MKASFLYNNSIVFLNIIEFHLFSEQIPADCHEFSIALKKKNLGNGLFISQYQKI